MTWVPPVPIRRPGQSYTLSATEAEATTRPDNCGLRTAIRARDQIQIDTGRWSIRAEPFTLGTLVDAIRLVHSQTAAGLAVDAAIRSSHTLFERLHPGVRAFFIHALNQYFDYHESREAQVGPLTLVNARLTVNRTPSSRLSTWGIAYETSTGEREIRRLRFGDPRHEVTLWAQVSAYVLAQIETRRPASSVTVTEVSLNTGLETHLIDGLPAGDAEQLYVRHVQPAARLAIQSTVPTPGRGCAQCRALPACSAVVKMDGFFQTSSVGPWTRSAASSDLALYETCPAQWYMKRSAHLPQSYEVSDGLQRGIAIHKVLEFLHRHGRPCEQSDFPQDLLSSRFQGLDPISELSYDLARPFLLHHIAVCPFRNANYRTLDIEHTYYGLDSLADVLLATKADMILLDGNTVVIREVKSTSDAIPTDADLAFDRYIAIAWDLLALDHGLSTYLGGKRGRVELELLTLTGSVVYAYDTTDAPLMRIAAGRIRRLGGAWLNDETWTATPGPHCSTCSVGQWCDSRQSV